jgi:hypothetical protein
MKKSPPRIVIDLSLFCTVLCGLSAESGSHPKSLFPDKDNLSCRNPAISGEIADLDAVLGLAEPD